jgi:hypothetical protein
MSKRVASVLAASRLDEAFQERRESVHGGSGENILFSTLLKASSNRDAADTVQRR